MAKCVGIEPFTLVMDLEGTDGRERGEVRLVLGLTCQENFSRLWKYMKTYMST